MHSETDDAAGSGNNGKVEEEENMNLKTFSLFCSLENI